MNLITQNNLTMSSYDFLQNVINPARIEAGESEVRNNVFISRIEDELDNLDGYKTFVTHGNEVKYYDLGFDQMMLVGMRESKAVRRNVLSKLKQLENSMPKLPDFNNPAESARAWAEQFEANQIAQQQLAEAQPKIDFVDRYASSTACFGFREVCKKLGVNEMRFREFLISNHIMYVLAGKMTAKQNHIDAGRFKVITGVNNQNAHAFAQAKFTAKGVEWVAGEWAKYNLRKQA